MSTQHDRGKKFFGMEVGTVVDNADPLKIGRCRVRVPGICEPYSAWALPIGGGSGPNRGAFNPPEKNAEVSIWFKAGDPDFPYYMPSNHGAPGGTSEAPGPVGGYRNADDPADAPAAVDAHLVPAWESERYVVFADNRPATPRLVIRDKKSDDQIAFDGTKYTVQIKATSLLHLKSDGVVKIDGATVNINGRVVASNGRPIK